LGSSLWVISELLAGQLSCPLHPRKQTGAVQSAMSAKGQQDMVNKISITFAVISRQSF